jgi:hypothetical protein
MHSLKINLYKVNTAPGTPPLADLLAGIVNDPLEDRVRRIGNVDLRLEHIAPPNTAGNATNYWLLDFIKMRMDHGPGKVGLTTAIEGFALAADEGFGEETAVLYDPDTDYAVVQYNHHGVRGATLQRYLSTYDQRDPSTGYELVLKLDETSEAKLAGKDYVTKVHFKIAPLQITAAHAANNVSLTRALALNDDQSGSTIELTIAASRGENLLQRGVSSLINNLRLWAQADVDQDTHALTQFQIEAKANLIDRAEKIDMLMPALQAKIDGITLGPDRRYTLDSRWTALNRARRGWREIVRH